MKKYLWFLLSLVSLSCRQSEQPTAPDIANKLAGTYELTYAYFLLTNTASTTTPSSLNLVIIDAQTVKPTFRIGDIPGGLIEQGTWKLTEVNQDSVFYRSSGYFGGVRNGRIIMSGYADGTL